MEYIYYLRAIDRAGNISGQPASNPSNINECMPETPVKAGVVERIITQGESIVRFADTNVYIPSESIDSEVKITIRIKDESNYSSLPEFTSSPIFEYRMEVNRNGEWQSEDHFKDSVVIVIKYQEDNLPEELNENMLNVAYYSSELEQWVIADESEVLIDTDNNLIFIHTDHFSDWVACGNPYLPEFEKSFGVSNETFYQDNNVQVNMYGSLTIKHKDISLPVPGGLPFTFTRTYNTMYAENDQMLKITCEYFWMHPGRIIYGDKTPWGGTGSRTYFRPEDQVFAAFGYGWRINLPYLCSRGHFHDSNGGAYQVLETDERWDNRPIGWQKIIHNGEISILVKRTDENYFEVVYSSGIRITLEGITNNRRARPIKIEEIGSSYYQTILYDPEKQHRLLSINDSLGRSILFTYIAIASQQIGDQIAYIEGIHKVYLKLTLQDEPNELLICEYSDGVLSRCENKLTNETYNYDYTTKVIKRGVYQKFSGLSLFLNP